MSVRERLKRSGPYVLGGSTLVLEQFGKVAEIMPSPFVKPAISLALGILDVIQTMRDNRQTCQTLMTQLGKLMVVALKPWVDRTDKDIPADLLESLKRLEGTLRDILSVLEKIRDAPKWKALLLARDRTEKLAECQKLMDQAMSFFQVDALIDGALKLDTVDRKMDVIGQNMQTVLENITANVQIEYPSSVLPARPDALFGRDECIEEVVGRLCYTSNHEGEKCVGSPPRLAILGPGGIGKTSVALAAASDDHVKRTYNEHIYWVPCEQATSPELLVELIARGMDIPKSTSGDRKRDVIDFLRRSPTRPRLLLLDNFETPWDIPTRQSDINDILYDIASVSPLTILLTMRSDILPFTRIRWTKPALQPLAALTLQAARDLYLDIHEDAGGDAKLDHLLNELAYMPLAVKLMANRGRLGEMPSTLLGLWEDQRVRTKLLHQGDDRITSVMVSVELSINSNLMHRNPDALILLGLLAELPGGTYEGFLHELAPSIADPGGALGSLRQAALVQTHPPTKHIQLLSPIRSLVLEKHRASSDIRTALRKAYIDLVEVYHSMPGDGIFVEAVAVLGLEEVNIETLLLDPVDGEPSDDCIAAVYKYAQFKCYTTARLEIMEKAINVVRSRDHSPEFLSRGLSVLVLVYRAMMRYDDAVNVGQEALAISRLIGDASGEINCLQGIASAYNALGRYKEAVEVGNEGIAVSERIGSQDGLANGHYCLGEFYLSMDKYDAAVSATQRALEIFKRMKDPLGEANCLRSLGEAYQTRKGYADAAEVTQRALTIYKQIGYPLGEAKCLGNLGDCYGRLGQHDAGLEVALLAPGVYKRIGNQQGEASSLRNLGDIYRALRRYEDAVEMVKKALDVYKLIGKQVGEAEALRSLGDAYCMMGQYDDSLESLQKALVIGKHVENKHVEANCLHSLGSTYLLLGRYDDAVEVGKQAAVASKVAGDQLSEANSFQGLGNGYRMLARYDDALEMGNRALEIYKKIGHPIGEGNSLRSLGKTYLALDRNADAAEVVELALLASRRAGDLLGEAHSLQSLGWIYYLMERRDDAAASTRSALELWERLQREVDAQKSRELLQLLSIDPL